MKHKILAFIVYSLVGHQLNMSPHSFCTQFKIPILKQQLSFYLNIKGIIYGRNSPWLHGDLNFTSESDPRSFTQKM